MWEFLVSIVPLIYLLVKEFLDARARATDENRTFQLSQAELKKIVDAATAKWVNKNAIDSPGAGDAWDTSDREKKKK